MKRKFISAMLFGALMVAPATTFVGCADYDDDIENLQGQITNNATTLDELTKEKIANVENEIKSLKDAQDQLKEAQEKATTDGDAATLAAATQLVNEAQARLQAALDAVNGEISDVNGSISALDARLAVADGKLSSVEALLAADGKITLAINDAQAMADKAYALAEQTAATANENKEAIKAAADNLKSIKESLEGQINTLSGKVNDLSSQLAEQNAALTAQIASLENQLKEAKDGNAANADKINANEGKINELTTQLNSLKEQVAANKLAVETLESNMLSKIQEVVNSTNTSINQLKEANAAAEERLTKAEGRLDTIDDLIASIQSTKADDAAIRELIANVKSELQNAQGVDKAALEQKINDLTAVVNGKASKDELDNAIANLKSTIENAQGVDKAALEQKISDLDSKIQTALNKKADKSYVDEEIRKLNEKFGELQASLDGLKKEDGTPIENFAEAIAAVQRNVNTVSNDITRIDKEIARIDGLVSVLFTDLSNLITGVIYQGQDFHMVYGKITAANLQQSNWTDAVSQMTKANDNKVYFPSKNKANITRVMDTYNMEKTGGYVYSTINPSSIDFKGQSLELVNSADDTHAQFKLGKANNADVLLTRGKKDNGLYAFEIQSKFADNSSVAPVTSDRAVYALQAGYKAHENVKDKNGKVTNEETTRKVYSKYEIQLNPTQAQRVGYNDFEIPEITAKPHTGTGRPWAGVNEEKYNFAFNSVNSDMVVDFTLKTDKPVYAKFIECTAGQATGAALGKPMTAENENFNKISVDLSKCLNQTVAFDYYIWNYDGSVEKKIYVLYVTRPMIDADTKTDVVKPSSNTTQTHVSNFSETTCMKDQNANTIWKNNASNFRIENVQGSALKGVQLVDANKSAIVSAAQADFGTNYINLTNHANIKGLKFTYDPALMEYDSNGKPKVYSFDVVFYKHNGNDNFLVNKVTIKYSLESFGDKYAEDLISPLAGAFTEHDKIYTDSKVNFGVDWGTTIAWATYKEDANGVGYATYKLNASFNHLEKVVNNSWVAFRDVTNYYVGTPNDRSAYATKNGTWFEKNANGDVVVNVPLIAVNKKNSADGPHVGFTYDFKVGVKYFGLQNLWFGGIMKDFKLVFKSPIYNVRNMNIETLTVGYPGEIQITDNNISGTDPSKSGNVKIHFLGNNQDNRIAKMEVKLVDEHKAGYLEDFKLAKLDSNGHIVEATNGIGATMIYIKAGGLAALQGADDIRFNLIITDKFGCVKTQGFSVRIDPNYQPSNSMRR